MADEENLGGEKAASTITSVPIETRKLAIASAAKAGLSMGEWMVAAVRNQANLESGERILPPSSSHSRNIPAPAASGPPVDMLALAELMRATQSLARGAGVAISQSHGSPRGRVDDDSSPRRTGPACLGAEARQTSGQTKANLYRSRANRPKGRRALAGFARY